MASYKTLTHSYKGYLQEVYYNNEQSDEKYAIELFNNFKRFSDIGFGPLPLFFIIDYRTKQYLLYSDAVSQISGYHPKEFLDAGLEMLMFVFHKDDFKIYNEKIFARNCEFLKSVPYEDHQDYLFSYTFRIKNREGADQHIWQKGCYITSPTTGLPLFSLGMCVDLSSLKENSKMVHSIEKLSGDHMSRLIETNYYFPNHEDQLLSKKEKEVLLYLSDGLSTKQIAGRMHVAETTVITHRKNMMQKCNVKNAVELVTYSLRNGLI